MPTTEILHDFSIDDIGVLMEAMEAWEQKDTAGEMLGSLMTALLVKKGDPKYESIMEEQARQKAVAEDEMRHRKERSILLRAKLVVLLDQARAAALIAGGPR